MTEHIPHSARHAGYNERNTTHSPTNARIWQRNIGLLPGEVCQLRPPINILL